MGFDSVVAVLTATRSIALEAIFIRLQLQVLGWITTTLLLCVAVPTPPKPLALLEISKTVAEENLQLD